MMTITGETRKRLLVYQKNEITEHRIYSRLAASMKDAGNRQILEQISADELRHYRSWKVHTGQDVAPDRVKVAWFSWIARILGFTFAIKLMEKGEESAQEDALIEMLDEERLRYVGQIVFGLNDALVELTGALAGLTLALQNTRLIALTGSITGIAAALSMGASEYVSTQIEDTGRNPLKAGDLHQQRLHRYSRHPDAALPAARKLLHLSDLHANRGGGHHCAIQLLHIGRTGFTVQTALPGDDDVESRRRRSEFRHRVADSRRAGRGCVGSPAPVHRRQPLRKRRP